jgi:tetratricopeptide (TPR) repeat protein
VNLLYNDMSHWTDIRVVDDERVADLLRDVPEAGRSQLGLEGGLAVARRAGARNLVMGDLLREGPRTSIVAKVFDVRTGTRVRTVRVQTVGTDSISASFSHLAQLVLAVPPPPGTSLSGVGTSSADALRAYSAGMEAYNRFRLDSAETLFRRAIALDSTFALAHFRLGSVLRTYRGPSSAQAARRDFDTAARLSGALPERERLLIAVAGATTNAAVCDLGARMLALDSSDANGWITVGNCQWNNPRVLAEPGGRVRPEGSWNAALRDYQRALRLEPENRIAIGRVMTVLWEGERLGCLVTTSAPCPLESLFVAAMVAEGDTIGVRFERWTRFDLPRWRRENLAGGRALLERARDFAATWTAANPRQYIGHLYYGETLLALGDLDGADREFSVGAEVQQIRGNTNAFTVYGYRMELNLRRERPTQAAALVDSLFDEAGALVTFGPMVIAFGRFSRAVGGADSTPRLRAQGAAFVAGFSGVVPADYPQTVRAYAETRAAAAAAGRADLARQSALDLGTLLGFHSLRSGPGLDTASALSLLRYQAFLVRADTARARRALAEFDSTVLNGPEDAFTGRELFSAESHLELGDSAAAWERMQRFARLWPGYSLYDYTGLWRLGPATPLIGRAWLLYADLAMARGARDEARRGYRFIVGLWEHGEAPVQPLVARARAALAQLGN